MALSEFGSSDLWFLEFLSSMSHTFSTRPRRRGSATLWMLIWLPCLLALFCVMVGVANLWLARIGGQCMSHGSHADRRASRRLDRYHAWPGKLAAWPGADRFIKWLFSDIEAIIEALPLALRRSGCEEIITLCDGG